VSCLRAVIVAGVFVADTGMVISQPDVSSLQLRLLNAQQQLELQQRQRNFQILRGDVAPEQAKLLQHRLDSQVIDQQQLQQRQLRQQQALQQQIRVAREPRGTVRPALQLKGFKRQQRQQQLNHAIQRRSW